MLNRNSILFSRALRRASSTASALAPSGASLCARVGFASRLTATAVLAASIRGFSSTSLARFTTSGAGATNTTTTANTAPNFLDIARNLINQPLSSRVQVGSNSYTVLEILQKSLSADFGGGVSGAGKSEVWYTCGLVLSHAAGGDAVDSAAITFEGKDCTARGCFVKSVEVDPTNSIAWNNLGASLHHDEYMHMPTTGERVDRHACFVKAVTFDPTNDRAWFNLGANLTQDTVMIGDAVLTRKDCFVKALTFNSNNSNGWYNLGVALGGVETAVVGSADSDANGKKYTSHDCFVKALEINPRNIGAWNYLGATIPEGTLVTINSEALSARQCFVKAIEVDPSSPAANISWNNVATTLQPGEHAAIAGKAFSSIQCYAKAIECDQTDSKSWQRLGIMMEPGMKIAIYGQDYSQQDCFIKAIEHDDEDAMAWHNAGATIRGRGDTIMIRGKPRTQRDCFIKALERDQMNSIAWYVVGTSLNSGIKETCSILGKTYTALDCFVKTVSVDPNNSLMWNNLAAAIPKGHTVDVELIELVETGDAAEGTANVTQQTKTVRVGRRECVLKAVELDPSHANAWFNLGLTMEEGEFVTVGGKQVSKAECVQRGNADKNGPTLSSYH